MRFFGLRPSRSTRSRLFGTSNPPFRAIRPLVTVPADRRRASGPAPPRPPDAPLPRDSASRCRLACPVPSNARYGRAYPAQVARDRPPLRRRS